MQIIEIKSEDKQAVCELLTKANKALEEAMFKLKESTKESEYDNRSWLVRENYRHDDYREPREDYRYHDDFRYRR